MTLCLTNTMKRTKEPLAPANPDHVTTSCLRADRPQPRPYRQCPTGGRLRRALSSPQAALRAGRLHPQLRGCRRQEQRRREGGRPANGLARRPDAGPRAGRDGAYARTQSPFRLPAVLPVPPSRGTGRPSLHGSFDKTSRASWSAPRARRPWTSSPQSASDTWMGGRSDPASTRRSSHGRSTGSTRGGASPPPGTGSHPFRESVPPTGRSRLNDPLTGLTSLLHGMTAESTWSGS